MKKLLCWMVCVGLLSGCNKEKIFDGPDFYQDDFEAYRSLEDLLLPDNVFWSYTQLTQAGNQITVDSTRAHGGSRALKFEAVASGEGAVSKASISKQKMAFWEGETVRMQAWYFMEGTDSLDWLFLMDLEEQAAIGAGPGMRLALVDNQIRVEYKFNERDILQIAGQEQDFPRNQWVELVWEVTLSKQEKGSVRIWQDSLLILNSTGNTTLPTDLLYFQQGTKGMYSSFEIGITANSRDNDLKIWVDDIRIEKVE